MARYKDSVSTTAHPTQARECLRQKSSRTKTVNVRRYQNQEATIDKVDHVDRDSPPLYADNLLENENLFNESGRISEDLLLQTTVVRECHMRLLHRHNKLVVLLQPHSHLNPYLHEEVGQRWDALLC